MESETVPPLEPGAEASPPVPSCPSCGALLRPDSNFCPSCGEALREGLKRQPRRPTARQILHDVQGSTGPVRRTLVFYGLWLVSGVISSVAAYAGAITVHVIIAMDAITAGVTGGWALKYRREVFRLYAWPRKVLWLAIPLLVAWPAAAAISLFIGWFNRLIGFDITYSSIFFADGYGWSWIVLLICVQPAVIEELAFRGILLSTMSDLMKPAEAVAVSAIAFAIMHFSLASLVPFALLGMYFGWMRLRSGSLWPAMIAHFAHNFLIIADERWPVLPG